MINGGGIEMLGGCWDSFRGGNTWLRSESHDVSKKHSGYALSKNLWPIR